MKAFVFVATGLFLAAVAGVGGLGLLDQAGSTPTEPTSDEPRRISSAELGRHASPSDCWIAVRGGAYDVTRYIEEHPAPTRTITDACGTDATVPFETKNRRRSHSPEAWELLESMRVGEYANMRRAGVRLMTPAETKPK